MLHNEADPNKMKSNPSTRKSPLLQHFVKSSVVHTFTLVAVEDSGEVGGRCKVVVAGLGLHLAASQAWSQAVSTSKERSSTDTRHFKPSGRF